MAKWMVSAKKADFSAWGEALGIDPVIARIIRNRDITTQEEAERFLHAGVEDMYPPWLMHGMKEAVALLQDSIRQGKRIRVIGDYDIDGICAAYILEKGLTLSGAQADTAIPHRMKDGYGLNESLVEQAHQDGVELIVTCDNGIAAAEQIAYANSLGMTVIVTDHHEVPYEEGADGTRREILPEAAVVIDPKQASCSYPFPGVCGAVVAFKLVQAMAEAADGGGGPMQDGQAPAFGRKGSYEGLLREFLGFAAFATIGDVMELKDENRIIVKYGLQQLKHTANEGLRALIAVNGLEEKQLTPYHIGYVLGPCLNASGRLDTAAKALELLKEKDGRKAAAIAGELKGLNDSRKDMTARGVEEACGLVEKGTFGADRVLVIYLPECHESLAGIIAGRVREKYGRPVFVLTRSEDGVKGSGRSIEAYHMYEEMSRCKELYTKYGGHKLAAGVSMPEENVDLFRRRLNEDCRLTEEDFEQTVHIDVPMPFAYVDEALIGQLSCLEPFGAGNPKPLFAQKNVRFLSGKILGKNQNVGKYIVEDDGGRQYEVIYFGDLGRFHERIEDKFGKAAAAGLYEGGGQDILLTIAYYPDINEYRGRKSIQFVMQHYC